MNEHERTNADYIGLTILGESSRATQAIARAFPLAGIAAAGLARSGQADPAPGKRYPRNSLGWQ